MVRFILKRTGYMLVTFYIVLTLTFLSMKLLPGTPFKQAQKLTPQQLNTLKSYYGLNDPIPVQYVRYVWNFIHGDMGGSFQYGNEPVTDFLFARFPISLQLGINAMIVGTVLGILLGIVAGINRGKSLDWGSTMVAIIGVSIPSFVLAAILQFFFSVYWRIFPVAGWGGFMYQALPTLALAIGVTAQVARFMRTEMVEVLNQDYIVTAQAKGLSRATVIYKHAVRNAMIPVITIVPPMTAAVVTGSLVIENIFNIPGIGSQFVDSIVTNDYPMIMGTTELYALLYIVSLLVVDILYQLVDPRMRVTGGKA
ncbi:ABC transporter permease [Sporolactobacillus laevolacticus]|uniref:Peptide ABC transporter permease n=1 Tax=Sporolactobacillus laevolacticus DSM 442 TaxID=1395513 RepID=V6IZD5_9BACL|nr:ABC transporter permease [Sporolactobacillus laevolacticus]EST12923.1 peptide ABC transporter permease [Sporolactobacillus laevolacticus DSM 442]